jgi:hypothetical protein
MHVSVFYLFVQEKHADLARLAHAVIEVTYLLHCPALLMRGPAPPVLALSVFLSNHT